MDDMACEECSNFLGWIKELGGLGGCFSVSIFPLGFVHRWLVFNRYFTEFDLTRLELCLYFPKEKRRREKSIWFFFSSKFSAFWFHLWFKKDNSFFFVHSFAIVCMNFFFLIKKGVDGFKVDFIEAYNNVNRDMLDQTLWLK